MTRGPSHHHVDDPHGQGSAHAASAHDFDSTAAIERIDADGSVHEPITDHAIARLVHHSSAPGTGTHGPRLTIDRIVDLGCGSGVAACKLAQAFPDAVVVATDASMPMLQATRERATSLGLSDRVQVQHLDLHDSLPGLGNPDVIWSSMAVHHAGNQQRLLWNLCQQLPSRGLICLIERDTEPRLTSDEAVLSPDVADRIRQESARSFAQMRSELPDSTPADSYAKMLSDAGCRVLDDGIETVSLAPPLPSAAQHLVIGYLIRAGVDADEAARIAPGIAFTSTRQVVIATRY